MSLRCRLRILAICLSCLAGACNEFVEAADAGISPPSCRAVAPTINPLTLPDLACGETEIRVPGINVQPGSNACPVTGVRWAMQRRESSGDDQLFSYEGALADSVPIEARVLGGRFRQPVFNVASYHGPTLYRIVIASDDVGDNRVSQLIGGLADDDYTLRVTLATDSNQSVQAKLFPDSSPFTIELGPPDSCLGTEDTGSCITANTLTGITKKFRTGMAEATPRLELVFDNVGTYYFDYVTLTQDAGGLELAKDTTFDGPRGSEGGDWFANCGDICGFEFVAIPAIFAEHGEFMLHLTALGTDGAESETMHFPITHAPCSNSMI